MEIGKQLPHGIEQRWVQHCSLALSSWQSWSKLATGVEASHQLGVSQSAWDLVLRKYILGIVQQY